MQKILINFGRKGTNTATPVKRWLTLIGAENTKVTPSLIAAGTMTGGEKVKIGTSSSATWSLIAMSVIFGHIVSKGWSWDIEFEMVKIYAAIDLYHLL